jgi:hypothetical protein
MADRVRRTRNFRTRRRLPGAVLLEQVRRREDLGVLRQIANLVAGAADAPARREHAAVREQQCSGVILARHSLRREGCPLAGRRVPPLRVVDAAVHVDQRGPGRVATGRQDAPVGKQREVVLTTAERHWRGGGDRGRGAVGVDHERGLRRRAAAGHQRLADVVDGVAPVAAVEAVALAEALPRTAARCVELAERRIWPRVEDATVGRNVHPWIERQVERRRAQRSQSPIGLPHLRRIGTTFRDQHLAVRERRHRRIPATGRHIGTEAPSVGHGVEQMRLDDALELRVLVTAGDEQRTVEEVRETGAEDVVALIDGGGCLRARDGVVDGGSRKIVNGKGLGRGIADGVPREHLAVRKQRDMDADDGPVDDRTPFPDLSGIGRDGRVDRLRCPRGPDARPAVSPRLERCAVDDRVFGLMARRSIDVVRQDGPGNTKRRRQHERDDERSTENPAAGPSEHHPSGSGIPAAPPTTRIGGFLRT